MQTLCCDCPPSSRRCVQLAIARMAMMEMLAGLSLDRCLYLSPVKRVCEQCLDRLNCFCGCFHTGSLVQNRAWFTWKTSCHADQTWDHLRVRLHWNFGAIHVNVKATQTCVRTCSGSNACISAELVQQNTCKIVSDHSKRAQCESLQIFQFQQQMHVKFDTWARIIG